MCLTITLSAQGISRLWEGGAFSVQVQAEAQYCFKDSAEDKSQYVDKFLSSMYVDAAYNSKKLSAGLRFEMYENPLPGFESDYKGVGIPHFYLTLRLGDWMVTAGDFYEQFGSGLLLRTYQERSLGIDNALRGARITYSPYAWLRFKALSGIQRDRWKWGETWVTGADVEADIKRFQIGANFVTKHEASEIIIASPGKRVNLPENVGAFSFRAKYNTPSFTIQSEYAWKANDPSSDNNYIFRPGQSLLLSASYFKESLGISIGAKHSDNMSFRSERTATENRYQINYLPVFTRQHTYALAAMYPYATQSMGEIAFQGDISYNFKKGTALGGKYGTYLHLNYSQVNAPKRTYADGVSKPQTGTYGYTTYLFQMSDELYFRDINVEMSKRINKQWKIAAMYTYQEYNQITRGKSGMIYSHIGVAEAQCKLNKKASLRGELQYLATKQDKGDWMAAVLELSINPAWVVTISDMYNIGGEKKENYPLASIAYTVGAHRLQLTGGKQREGYNCAGGICRYVPTTTGISLSYTSNF